MRAAFGFLVMVLVMGGVLMLAKQQAKLAAPTARPASSSASAAPAQTAPQAVEQQVKGLLEQGAQRASEAQP
ncbi:hypothetical protein HNQ51_001125 [Inhella inkyongensis]|uniref:Uncharacterized protein n=1 Tax=Inhella inkyongensis TaxID=392593 RepID=A0A840S2S2_9BURK|nr:hypothetical protein [Inhella inkyongensis]MBB5203832.1 hypothetical protein [Inhella inkyongensis]